MTDSSFQSVNGLPVNYQQLMMNNQNIVVSPAPPPVMDGNVFDNLPSAAGTDMLISTTLQDNLSSSNSASTLSTPSGNLFDLYNTSNVSPSTQDLISGVAVPPGDLIGMGADFTIKTAFESPTQYTPSGSDTGSLYGNIASSSQDAISGVSGNSALGNVGAILSTGPTGVSIAIGTTDKTGPSGISIATGVTGATGPSGVDIALAVTGATGPTGVDPSLFLIKADPTKMSKEQKDRVMTKLSDLENGIGSVIKPSNGWKGGLGVGNPILLALMMAHNKKLASQYDRGIFINPPLQRKPIQNKNVFLTHIGTGEFANVHDHILKNKLFIPGTGMEYMFGNCAEQAGFMAAEIINKIKTDPDFAGLRVQQIWVGKNGMVPRPDGTTKSDSVHSFVQVEFPDGSTRILDPWRISQGGLADDSVKDYYPPQPDTPNRGWNDNDQIVVTNLFP